ncbi:MAG: hypothetical protein QGG19_14800 [Alphaproteobacteria bacterium]|jgi:hypothetical protein|nr:hypothetical protein [Alphaproteobacteria bacterium]
MTDAEGNYHQSQHRREEPEKSIQNKNKKFQGLISDYQKEKGGRAIIARPLKVSWLSYLK